MVFLLVVVFFYFNVWGSSENEISVEANPRFMQEPQWVEILEQAFAAPFSEPQAAHSSYAIMPPNDNAHYERIGGD